MALLQSVDECADQIGAKHVGNRERQPWCRQVRHRERHPRRGRGRAGRGSRGRLTLEPKRPHHGCFAAAFVRDDRPQLVFTRGNRPERQHAREHSPGVAGARLGSAGRLHDGRATLALRHLKANGQPRQASGIGQPPFKDDGEVLVGDDRRRRDAGRLTRRWRRRHHEVRHLQAARQRPKAGGDRVMDTADAAHCIDRGQA